MAEFKSSHVVTIRNSFSGIADVPDQRLASKVTNECLPKNTVIHLKVNSDERISTYIRNRTSGFTVLAGTILLINFIMSKNHIEKFEMTFSTRADNLNQHGQNMVSYPSQFSLFSHFLLLLANFLIFFIFFELSMVGVMNSMFFVVMILHFSNSFCFLGHVYILHVKILALDKYRDFDS